MSPAAKCLAAQRRRAHGALRVLEQWPLIGGGVMAWTAASTWSNCARAPGADHPSSRSSPPRPRLRAR